MLQHTKNVFVFGAHMLSGLKELTDCVLYPLHSPILFVEKSLFEWFLFIRFDVDVSFKFIAPARMPTCCAPECGYVTFVHWRNFVYSFSSIPKV